MSGSFAAFLFLQLRTSLLGAPVKDVLLVDGTHIVKPSITREQVFLGRNLRHGVEGTFGLLHPDALHLAVFQKHLQQRCLCIVQTYQRTVGIIDGIIDDAHVVNGLRLTYLPLFEEGFHLF